MPAERSEVNVAILRNLLDVVETASPALEHVTFYQGGKAYGADLGPFKTPAREDDPRLSGFIPGDLRGHSRQGDRLGGLHAGSRK
jgi:hypothetical protein